MATVVQGRLPWLLAVCVGGLLLWASPAAANFSQPPKPVLYLTFDDGPGVDTPAFLDLLASHDIAATFFVTGGGVSWNPGSAERIVAEEHAIANHTWSHPNLAVLSDGEIARELQRTTDIIFSTTGVRPVCYRPPYGATSERVHAQAVAAGLPNAEWVADGSHWGLWDIDTNDWRLGSGLGWSEGAMEQELDKARNGATVLMHDGPGDRKAGLAVLARWLADNAKRFEFRVLPGCGVAPAEPEELVAVELEAGPSAELWFGPLPPEPWRVNAVEARRMQARFDGCAPGLSPIHDYPYWALALPVCGFANRKRLKVTSVQVIQ